MTDIGVNTSPEQEIVAKVLVVDDRPENLLAMQAVLEPLGFPLVLARSGEEALRRALEQDFAVVLLDVQMPGMDGFETATLLHGRQRSRSTPIIFVTAINREPRYIREGYARGAVDYIVKPFEPAIMQAKVAVFVELYLRAEKLKAQAALLKERERELYVVRSQARFQNLIDVMPIAAWAARPDGTVYFANAVARAHCGDSLLGASLSALPIVHPEDTAGLAEAWGAALPAGAVFERPVRLRRIDEEHRWHVVRGAPEAEEASLAGWIVTAVDIHDQKVTAETQANLLENAARAAEAAEAANRMKDEFLATVSHELRTPLTAILGWSTLLAERTAKADAELRKGMAAIERNARAQKQLVEDLLDVSRIITGKLHVERRAVSLKALVSSTFEGARPTAVAKGVTMTLQLDEALDCVDVDPVRFQQVIGNLVSNAVKFTPAGGRIEVSTALAGDDFLVRVRDTGSGISPAFLPHAFERFRQADSSQTRAAGGLGLGLSIVRHLVELHGGKVTAESAGEGKGATFTVLMPGEARRDVPEPQRPSATRAAEPSAAERLAGVRVLVVEDSDDARELLGELLVHYGAEVSLAASAREALDAIARMRPDVLVSDLGMPGQDGYALVSELRRRENGGPRLPAIALTGFARSADEAQALEAGFDRHLAKPVDPPALVEGISAVLSSR